MTACAAFRGCSPRPWWRIPYLAAAYLAQEAFKEPIEALFVLAFALLLPERTTLAARSPGGDRGRLRLCLQLPGAVLASRRRGDLRGVTLLTGTSGPPGSARRVLGRTVRAPAASARSGSRRDPGRRRWRSCCRAHRPGVGADRRLHHFRAFRASTISGGLGNLRHQLSPLEALGIWPASDFRLSASDASGPRRPSTSAR